MHNGPDNIMKTTVAVVGMGYWGKNLVRNFYELGALSAICDSNPSVETICKREYGTVRPAPFRPEDRRSCFSYPGSDSL
jgi:predicted dehydrogenase